MAFMTVNSNTPLDLNNPLISFRVRGTEVAALLPDGAVKVEGVWFPDKSYIKSASSDNIDGGTYDPLDGGQF